MARNIYLEMLPPAKALEIWLKRIDECCAAPGEETIPLAESLDRVVSQPVIAARSSPAFHGAAMDGIAVAAEKTFTASPREPLKLEVGKDAFWINTGRPLPPATNAVIMVEHLNSVDDGRFVVVERAAFPWQHVRKAGEDMVATEIILPPGTTIGPYELGAMAAAGVINVAVFKKPLVAIIPSGSEIAPINEISAEDLASGKRLPEFNSLLLSAIVKKGGAKSMVLPIAPDDPARIAASILKGARLGANLLIINAGASAGSHDFSAEAIRQCGELLVHGVSMMPGKPVALGLVKDGGKCTPILGAPGYPVSASMAVEEFAIPVLAKWRDQIAPEREMVEVYPCNPLPSRPGMEERIRVKLGSVNGRYFAIPLPRGAGVVGSLSRADAILPVPPDSEGLDAGQPAMALLLRPRHQIEDAILAIGSHDNTLDLIDSLIRRKHPRFRLTSAHVGSLGGLKALAAGQAHLGGCHLLDPGSGEYNKAAIREQLKGVPVVLVRLVEREQGLMTRPGNPLCIKSFEDLAGKGVRFINRQRGSGTRTLLDFELEKRGISPADIPGYTDEEYTHMNVAEAVLSGRADVGLGARSAANALGLEFIPVGMEDYDLVIPREYLGEDRIKALLEVIRSKEFRNAALAMGGYGVEKTGEIIWEYDGK